MSRLLTTPPLIERKESNLKVEITTNQHKERLNDCYEYVSESKKIQEEKIFSYENCRSIKK